MRRPQIETFAPIIDGIVEEIVTPDVAWPEQEPVNPWRAIVDAPQDGTLIEYKTSPDLPDHAARTARWRITRVRNVESKRWDVVGYWSDPITREQVPLKPVCWRMPEGFINPGMIMGG